MRSQQRVFRAEGDRPVVTFNLCYEAISGIVVRGYDIWISDLCLYNDGTKTIVVREKCGQCGDKASPVHPQ